MGAGVVGGGRHVAAGGARPLALGGAVGGGRRRSAGGSTLRPGCGSGSL
ncbi:MAG: hypothetical protein WKG07_04670 [Hymenobacter sp.]